MTKEDILKAYLEDDLFIERNYLKEGEVSKFKLTTFTENKLINIVKLAIDGEMSNDSSNVIEKKINTFLNTQS